MGRAKYSQDEKDHALGALMASAVRGDDGGWEPDFKGTARAIGISDMTLRRWWKARDRAGDVALRRSATRGTEEAVKAGARSWADSVHERLAKCVDVALAELEKPCERGKDKNGRGWEIGPNPAQRMAAIKTAHEMVDALDARINDKGERSASKIGSARKQFADAIRRAGLKAAG